MIEGESHWKKGSEDHDALSAASGTFHKRNTFVDRNRGKFGFVAGFGLAAGIAVAYHQASRERPEQIQPQVQGKVIGVLLCGTEGCVIAVQPEEMEELGDGCEEPPAEIPPECFGGIPHDFSKDTSKPEKPALGVEL